MTKIGYIGLGLIGGSIAKAIRKYHPDYQQVAYSRTMSTVESAIQEHVIDAACTEHDPEFGTCDIIFLCAPVETNIGYMQFLAKTCSYKCIITDVGSVKSGVMEAASRYGIGHNFIGGHPMAGSERTGFANATDYLLENAYYFLTPGHLVPGENIERLKALVESLKAIPIITTGEEHDYIVAGVSHLPHIVASTLVNTVKGLDTDDEKMKLVAAGGFRDITRIASSSPEMWEQICTSNKEQIVKVLDDYIDIMYHAKALVTDGNKEKLLQMFQSSKNYRDSLNDFVNGALPRQYALYVDIYDEAGGIATITTLLAMSDINIKNIGIIHNREFEEGVLRIEFYTEKEYESAGDILRKRNYIIRKRT